MARVRKSVARRESVIEGAKDRNIFLSLDESRERGSPCHAAAPLRAVHVIAALVSRDT